ncbi:DUF354 domain-containing protein [Cytobacillus oceanisediminis]|uniref:surface carbohydrate biosynthesis protein n=1 Tax=Cytobacillus oceanisediminis TaxID=665099 RepID=UPI001D152D1B|nr:surface carbohydrate biosynthesis protein [Cytobacillus oceanisediminis]MCC3646351.1 DUF354 domain-containing protein [Cytobacillus oceanisediminis]
MSGKWLYLPIEVAKRETDAKLLLAYYALKEKYNVVIGDQYEIIKNVGNFPKGIFLSKGHTRNNFHFAFNVKAAGHIVVELDEEALFLNKAPYIKNRTDEKLFSIMEQIYCWGKFQRDTLLNEYPHFREKIYLTGHPRFDLLKKKFNRLYWEDAEKIKKQFGNFILVNTRFSMYNTQNGFNENNKELKSLYESFIIMVKILSKKFPNHNIVVRPHPTENSESYKSELKNLKNVYVISHGSVVKWIIASKLIIHNGCTTGIEAFLLGHPVISYMPVKSEKIDEFLPNEVSFKIDNIEDLNSFVDVILTKKRFDRFEYIKKMNEKKNVLFQYYETFNENYAYQNILNLLGKININSPVLPHSTLNTFYQNLNKASKIIISREKLDSEIKESEINNLFFKLNEIENTKNSIIIQNYNRHIFVIRPK